VKTKPRNKHARLFTQPGFVLALLVAALGVMPPTASAATPGAAPALQEMLVLRPRSRHDGGRKDEGEGLRHVLVVKDAPTIWSINWINSSVNCCGSWAPAATSCPPPSPPYLDDAS